MGQPPRVQVHYFEKKPKPRPPPAERHTQELKIPAVSRGASLGEMEPPIASPLKAEASAPKGRKRRRKASQDDETRVTDPHISVPERLDAWLQQGGEMSGMSRQQIAELCVFGHHLFENGRIPEAKVVFEGIVALGVTDAFPHTMLGTILLAQGDPKDALELFESALKLDDRDVAARVYRGEIRMRAGNIRAGLADLRKAATMAPSGDPFAARAKKLIERATRKKPKK